MELFFLNELIYNSEYAVDLENSVIPKSIQILRWTSLWLNYQMYWQDFYTNLYMKINQCIDSFRHMPVLQLSGHTTIIWSFWPPYINIAGGDTFFYLFIYFF